MNSDLNINKNYLTRNDYISYSGALFGSSAMLGLTQTYLMIFYTTILGINGIAVGTMFLIAKVWDGINDPIMGTIIDRTRTKWGKMRPYLMFASVPWGIIIITMFIPISLGSTGNIIFMYVSYLVFEVFSTAVDVPMQGICAVVTPNTGERSKFISFGRFCAAIGEQSALVLVSVGFIFIDSAKAVYLITAVIIGSIGPVLIMISGKQLKERVKPTDDKPRVIDAFIYLFKNKPLLTLICSNLLTFFRNIVTAMIYYVVTYIFMKPSLQILFALPGAIAGAIGMLIAPLLKKKFSAKTIFIIATIWHSIALTLVFVIGTNYMDMILIAGLMFVAMIPVGVLNVVPSLMAADTIDYMEHKTGERKEGITYSLMTLRSKVSSGLKDFVMASIILTAIGFSVEGTGVLIPGMKDVFQQTDGTKKGLFMAFTLIPAICNLSSIIPMLFYKLTGDKLKHIQEELLMRRNNKDPLCVALTEENENSLLDINIYM